MPTAIGPIYQLKSTLLGTHPPVWRRVQVPADITLGKLHWVIQTAMGWMNSHLHAFNVGGVSYGETDPELEFKSETRVKLRQAAPKEKSRFRYEYDFGDDWQHDILLEKILPAAPGTHYPICIKAPGTLESNSVISLDAYGHNRLYFLPNRPSPGNGLDQERPP